LTTLALVKQSVRSMARYKLRTGFMMVGSLVGVAALTFAVSLGQGLQRKVMKTIHQVMGDGSVLIIGGGSRMMGSPHAGAARLTVDDIASVVKEVPGIADWDPQADLTEPVRRADSTATVRVLGESEHWRQVWGRGVSRGEPFDAAAVSGSSRVALIGETVAHRLFPGEDPVDAEIQIGAVSFRVIGVLEPFGIDMHGMDRDNEIVVPISTLMHRLTNVDAIGAAKLLITDPAGAKQTAHDVREVLRRRHALDRDQPDDFMIVTALQAQRMVAMIQRVLFVYVPLVASIVLLVGGIVAAALMLGAVNERVSEIGLRRAVGAQTADIRRQFALETAAIVLIGGVAGIAIAYVGVSLVARRLQLDGAFSWTAVAVGVGAAALTGWLAGVLPARRAAGLHPIDALR
jgi:putative ABC transport system permease protein